MNYEPKIFDIPGIIKYKLWLDMEERTIFFQILEQHDGLISRNIKRKDPDAYNTNLQCDLTDPENTNTFFVGTYDYPELAESFVALRGRDSERYLFIARRSFLRDQGEAALAYLEKAHKAILQWSTCTAVIDALNIYHREHPMEIEQLNLFTF